jgi:hypothetical protein
MVRECSPPAREPARSWLARRSIIAMSTPANAKPARQRQPCRISSGDHHRMLGIATLRPYTSTTTHVFRWPGSVGSGLRRAIMGNTPGACGKPPWRYTSDVERSGSRPLPFVCCGRTAFSRRTDGARVQRDRTSASALCGACPRAPVRAGRSAPSGSGNWASAAIRSDRQATLVAPEGPAVSDERRRCDGADDRSERCRAVH